MNIVQRRAQEFIAMYGGTSKVAEMLDTNKQTISTWKKRGIPEGMAYKITVLTRGVVSVVWLRPDLFKEEDL